MSNIKIITGHFGSGKTEFSVNYAINAALKNRTILVDLDIVNPYFRSREQEALLKKNDVVLVGGSMGLGNVSADMPALPAEIYGHIDNRFDTVVFDVGGDANGARVLSRFSAQFNRRDYDLYMVVNANRPNTQTPEKVIQMLTMIAAQSRLKVNGLINNTHLLRETTIPDIEKGIRLCEAVSSETGLPIVFNVIPRFLDGDDVKVTNKFVIDMFLRPEWL
jgi:hypothetical protein